VLEIYCAASETGWLVLYDTDEMLFVFCSLFRRLRFELGSDNC